MVQRTFPDGLQIPISDEGADTCTAVVEQNLDQGVTWLHSYVSVDKQTTFCVYDAPSPLLSRFCQGLGRSVRILWAACDPLFTPRPLGPLLDVARETDGELRAQVERGAQPHEVTAAGGGRGRTAASGNLAAGGARRRPARRYR
jgi:hypothetical protein